MDDFKQYLKYINNCDRDQPLISETRLGHQLDTIPLNQVQPKHLVRLFQDLNLEQLITTEQGIARDYRGLAELMGFSTLDIETHFKKSINPTKSAIEAYLYKRHDNNSQEKLITLNDLIRMIEQIERFDVIDDFIPEVVKIAAQSSSYLSNSFNERGRAIESPKPPIDSCQDTLVSNTKLLTIDDTKQPSGTCYDAFVCFAPEDDRHAESLISYLEQSGKTVATTSDLLPGNFEHDSLVQLIDNRCRKVIIILTPNFLRSKECGFQTKFANEIGIKAGSPMIIPVLCETCNDLLLPPLIRVISKIDLTNPQSRSWQLNKLLSSLAPETESRADDNMVIQIQHQPHSGRSQRQQEQILRQESRRYSTTEVYGAYEDVQNQTDTTCCNPQTNQAEPFVEIMHSETELQRGACSNDTNKPLNWLKKIRRATTGPQLGRFFPNTNQNQPSKKKPNGEAPASEKKKSTSVSVRSYSPQFISNRSSSSRAGLLSETSSEG